MLQSNDLSRSFTALNQDNTLIVVIEMGQSSWLVSGMVPGVERQPLKKLEPDEDQLLKLMDRWRHEALQAGHAIKRVVVAYEAGRDGFWLARWLRERGVEDLTPGALWPTPVRSAADTAVGPEWPACRTGPCRRTCRSRLPARHG